MTGAPPRPVRFGGEAAGALLLAAIILAFAVVSFGYNGVLAHARPPAKNDFTSYYVGGLAVREGMPGALYYPDPVGSLLAQATEQRPWADLAHRAGIEHPNYYLYPPLFAVLFAPMTLLSYPVAFAVWLALGAIFLCAALALMLGTYEGGLRGVLRSPRAMLAAAGAVLVSVLFYPVSRNLAVGQSSLLLLLLLTATLVALRRRTRGGDAAAGLCLAGGILLKLTPLIFLPYLAVRRRWRAIGMCLAALALLTLLSVAVAGVEPHRLYFGRMVGLLSGGSAFYPNQSLGGVLARLAGGDFRLADLLAPDGATARVSRWLGMIVLAAAFLQAARRRPGGEPDPEADDQAFATLVTASLLVSPISWEHHYVLALIPAWLLVREASQMRGLSVRRAALAGAGLALCGSYVGLRVITTFGDGLPAALISASGFAGGLLLWLALMAAPMNPPLRIPVPKLPAAAPSLLVLLGVFAAGNFLLKVSEYGRSYGYGDFTSYYVAAATLAEGSGDPLYYPGTPDPILARAVTPSPWTETAARHGVREANYYLYPPFFAMAMTPLTLVPYETAHAIWYLASLAALAGCLWLYAGVKRRSGEPLTATETALAIIAVCLSWPALFTFGAGQANWIVLLLLSGALASLRAGGRAPAGLMTAGATAIKMTPALALVWLGWRRRWSALLWALAGLVGLILAGAAVAGWGAYDVYARQMIPLLSRGCAHWVNQSLPAFFTRVIDGADMFSWDLADPSRTSRLLAAASGLALIVWVFRCLGPWRAGRGSGRPIELEFSLIVMTTLFLSPLSWTHHSVLSLMGLVLLARWLIARSMMTHGMALALAVSFALTHAHVKPPGFFELPPLRVLASLNLIGNLILWWLIAVTLRRTAAAPAGTSAGGAL